MKICEAGRDSCGCNNWSKGIRTIDGQYPDDNRDFNLSAGDGIEITPITAGVEISVKAPLPGPMIFRGTVGTGGTITTLPDANVDNIGWTYVAITAGTTPDDTPQSYDVGDTLVSNGSEWTVIPSGDDPVAWSQITGKPTTVSGYGITDAITGSGSIGTDTKPIKIVNGAAVAVTNDLVDVASQQTISKLKIWQSNTSADTLIALRTNKTYVSGIQYSPQIEFDADDTNEKNGVIGSERTSATNSRMFMDVHDPNTGVWKGGLYLVTDGNDAWAECPKRTYDASNINDIVTIGSLQSSSDVVHRTGNENISGIKTFDTYSSIPSGPLDVKHTGLTYPSSSDVNIPVLTVKDKTGVIVGTLYFRSLSNGTTTLYAGVKNGNGTFNYVQLAGGTP